MGLRNTITRAATATARKSGLVSRCNLFLLVWQRFWLRFRVLWLLLCLSTSGNCKYSFCLSTLGEWREGICQICFELGFRKKTIPVLTPNTQRATDPFHPIHYTAAPWLSQPTWAGKPPRAPQGARMGPRDTSCDLLEALCSGWAVRFMAGGVGMSQRCQSFSNCREALSKLVPGPLGLRNRRL